ncbi:MAG: TlpA family protein disulfide reductase [Rhodoluna sp.]
MPLDSRLLLVAGLIAFAVAAGVLWSVRTGRAKAIGSGEVVDLLELAAIKNGQPVTKFGKRVTFLQFSSEFCTSCRQTARAFAELEEQTPDMLHIEIDITDRIDLAKKYKILQTPTTFVLDPKGRVTSRIGGAAKTQTIQDELGNFEI